MAAAGKYIILLTLVFNAINLRAQNFAGIWEGSLGEDQFLRMNIFQNGNRICGYSYDHLYENKNSNCIAFVEFYFDEEKKKLNTTGKYFIYNSGTHTLIKLSLTHKTVKGTEVLEQRPTAGAILSAMLNPFSKRSREGNDTRFIYLKKVSDKPTELNNLFADCMHPDNVITDSIAAMPDPEKENFPEITDFTKQENNTEHIPEPVQITEPEKQAEMNTTIADNTQPENQLKNLPGTTGADMVDDTTVNLPGEVDKRKNIEQSHITLDVKTINLKVYDNAIIDGDTVSIYYNGKLLVDKQLLTVNAINIDLELDENQTRHEIILFAENLGSIPPNTALVVITAGDKRYELFASASLEENAVLVFEYKPK